MVFRLSKRVLCLIFAFCLLFPVSSFAKEGEKADLIFSVENGKTVKADESVEIKAENGCKIKSIILNGEKLNSGNTVKPEKIKSENILTVEYEKDSKILSQSIYFKKSLSPDYSFCQVGQSAEFGGSGFEGDIFYGLAARNINMFVNPEGEFGFSSLALSGEMLAPFWEKENIVTHSKNGKMPYHSFLAGVKRFSSDPVIYYRGETENGDDIELCAYNHRERKRSVLATVHSGEEIAVSVDFLKFTENGKLRVTAAPVTNPGFNGFVLCGKEIKSDLPVIALEGKQDIYFEKLTAGGADILLLYLPDSSARTLSAAEAILSAHRGRNALIVLKNAKDKENVIEKLISGNTDIKALIYRAKGRNEFYSGRDFVQIRLDESRKDAFCEIKFSRYEGGSIAFSVKDGDGTGLSTRDDEFIANIKLNPSRLGIKTLDFAVSINNRKALPEDGDDRDVIFAKYEYGGKELISRPILQIPGDMVYIIPEYRDGKTLPPEKFGIPRDKLLLPTVHLSSGEYTPLSSEVYSLVCPLLSKENIVSKGEKPIFEKSVGFSPGEYEINVPAGKTAKSLFFDISADDNAFYDLIFVSKGKEISVGADLHSQFGYSRPAESIRGGYKGFIDCEKIAKGDLQKIKIRVFKGEITFNSLFTGNAVGVLNTFVDGSSKEAFLTAPGRVLNAPELSDRAGETFSHWENANFEKVNFPAVCADKGESYFAVFEKSEKPDLQKEIFEEVDFAKITGSANTSSGEQKQDNTLLSTVVTSCIFALILGLLVFFAASKRKRADKFDSEKQK